MLLSMRKKTKYIPGILASLLIMTAQPVWAAGPPEPSILSNPLALTLMILMALLLIIIGILANILIGAADVKLKKRNKPSSNKPVAAASLILVLLLASSSLFAQDAAGTADAANTAVKTIGGMSASTFYIMVTVLFLELFIIIALLINIKFLLKTEKEKLATAVETEEVKANRLSWWDRFNKLSPVSEEADLDLGHDYDGIRELDNRLPPWWLYGFYLCIIFAGIYLWRFHVSHTGPSSKQEYERSVARADAKIQEYLKQKGESVDENTVTLLTSADDIQAGKTIFMDPAKCPACHGTDGGGNAVGPNLTDDYWIYGGSIKTIFKTIKYGANNGMKSWKDELSAKQMAQVASYIKSLRGTKPANPKAPQGELYKEEAAPAAPAADSTAADAKKIAMNN
ncbi:MAG: c-type cytochrome [Chitinophagaceae bacterium]|nr:c-type cytochrome [Chitinophagaceae bacterium]